MEPIIINMALAILHAALKNPQHVMAFENALKEIRDAINLLFP